MCFHLNRKRSPNRMPLVKYENSKAAMAHKRWYSAEDVASTAQTMRATLGQHPHLGGGFDDAMRGFTPPSQTSSDADDGKLASVFAGRNGSAAYGRIRTTPGSEAKDSAAMRCRTGIEGRGCPAHATDTDRGGRI